MKLASVFSLLLLSISVGLQGQTRQATVPLIIEGNRLFVNVEFQRQHGSARTARLWLDTGDPDFRIAESLARDLGLDLSAPPTNGEDGKLIPVHLPEARIGNMAIHWGAAKPLVVSGDPRTAFAGSGTEGNLPATVLMQYQMVIDIPGRRFTLAEPGTLRAHGKAASCRINPKTGMVQVDATIDEKNYSLALDSGAPYSMASGELLKQWAAQHSDWPQSIGAVGPANLLPLPGFSQAQMLRVPQMTWGPLRLRDVGLGGLPKDFVAWYSRKTTEPVAGFLATNILRGYRVLIDYPASKVYFQQRAETDKREMDIVGITLTRARAGGYAILSAAQKDGKDLVADVQKGDRLLKIDQVAVDSKNLAEILELLRGRPSETRTLLIERNGKQIEIRAQVQHIL